MKKPQLSDLIRDTIQYYESHAQDFVDRTFKLDLGSIYQRFAAQVPTGSHILDAGCGSGRDALHFQNAGYKVTAFDASPKLARLATELTGIQVEVKSFLDLEYNTEFDGIWACASLLHLPTDLMDAGLRKLITALKPGGILYASFKYGEQEQIRNGRLFSNYNETTFKRLIQNYPELELVDMWKSGDTRPDRSNEIWLNALLRKEASGKNE